MRERDLLDDIAAIGWVLLGQTRTQREVQRYSLLLAQICELVRDTHALVVEKLDAIETAASLAEARACAAELRDFPLTESFRIRGLCEIFGGYGRALERLERDGTLDALPLAQQQRWAWVRFRETLEEREAQVATLYAREIREIAYLVLRAEQAAELAELREAARRARHRLTVQMSEFDALAGEFRHR